MAWPPAASTLATQGLKSTPVLAGLETCRCRKVNPRLQYPPAAYPLPHLLLPRSWPACCLSSTHVCCQMVFLCEFLWLAPGRFPKVNAGLEKHPSSFNPWPQSRFPRSSRETGETETLLRPPRQTLYLKKCRVSRPRVLSSMNSRVPHTSQLLA